MEALIARANKKIASLPPPTPQQSALIELKAHSCVKELLSFWQQLDAAAQGLQYSCNCDEGLGFSAVELIMQRNRVQDMLQAWERAVDIVATPVYMDPVYKAFGFGADKPLREALIEVLGMKPRLIPCIGE